MYSVLRAGDEGQIVVEVLAQLDVHHVRGIALTPTQGFARGINEELFDVISGFEALNGDET
jgi:F-type H+-transporting ATPase subunit beta